jgi:hypothetical protein
MLRSVPPQRVNDLLRRATPYCDQQRSQQRLPVLEKAILDCPGVLGSRAAQLAQAVLVANELSVYLVLTYEEDGG